MICVKPPKPLLHANFGGYFFAMMGGVRLRSTFLLILAMRLIVMCSRLGAPLLRGGRFRWLLKACGKGVSAAYRGIVGFCVFYERIHPFLDGNGRTGRMIMFRECLRGGLVPFIVLDAEKAEYYRAIRTFEDDGEERFVRFAEHMAELYFEEFSSLIPQNLLLPPLEEYVKHSSFDESDLSFFE